jgi:integrase
MISDWLWKKVLHHALKSAGIARIPHAHGFHLFRHSAGSIGHAATRDLKLAQDLLGNSRILTTSDIYVHLDPTTAEEAIEALATAIIQ